ncbi:unnamed protein product [Caenorhabditis auriculariae]|uniref:Tetratricopeptide repeat protein 27 n=1 Tax=Caenorhabditis auriculariae TaxID=2777116 RepID=A0A8S1GZ48_9PELO|nr:unnamed protein product [Caenorhabditis auriculariae]
MSLVTDPSCSNPTVELSETMDERNLLLEASMLLHRAVASNFAGFPGNCEQSSISEEEARKKLSFESNPICSASRSSKELYTAKRILYEVLPKRDLAGLEFEFELNKLRCCLIWQLLLVEPSKEIREIGQISITCLEHSLKQQTNTDLVVRTLLEMVYFHFQYYDYDQANAKLNDAVRLSEINIELTGMLGKRTRFQNKSIAQLVLLNTERTESAPLDADVDVPTNCALNDDTLLEEVTIQDSTEDGRRVDGRTLRAEQLACLLWMARFEFVTHRSDSIVEERCMPFINTVLASRRCWPLQASALLLRSELEKKNKRMVERACSQTELLHKLMTGIDDLSEESTRFERANFALAAGLWPFWQVAVLQSSILRSLGCTSEALIILEKLELWDDVISCYKSLGQLEKAETLIRRLLEEKPHDSMLHVYLGDITHNTEYYEKAIEISGDRNSRARRSLGHLFLMQKKFEDAFANLQRSLELQPIQLGTWFNAGYCAWMLQKYGDAIKCYHRCVCLEPEHFEAWSNLSAAYIRAGQKEKAWKLLQEALKFNYEHAKVWENFMLLSVDVGDFSQAIMAYNRLLDLKKRESDEEVLEIIARQVLHRQANKGGNELKELEEVKNEMIKLLARISSTHTLSSKVLELYADLKKPSELTSNTTTTYEQYVQLLEKSSNVASNKQNWHKNEEEATRVLESAVKLSNERLVLAGHSTATNAQRDANARIRLSLKSLLARADQGKQDRPPSEFHDRLIAAEHQARQLLALVS